MRHFALLIIAAGLGWCGGTCAPVRPAFAHEAEPGYRKGQIHAVQAWARISPLKGRPAAAFFTLHNESQVADAVVGVRTPIARRAELHTHMSGPGGVMRMRAVSRVEVAPGDMVVFEPGGFHVMLFDITAPPARGARFPLTLTFAKGKPQTILVTARGLAEPAPGASMDHDKMPHHAPAGQ